MCFCFGLKRDSANTLAPDMEPTFVFSREFLVVSMVDGRIPVAMTPQVENETRFQILGW